MTNSKKKIGTRWVVSYLRVSTAKQTGESKTGIKRQVENQNAFMAAHPECKLWEEEFQDLGVSGRGDNRRKRALARIIDQAERGIFPPKTILLVESVSRLTRDTQKEGLRLLIKLFDLGFSIAFTEWGGQILDEEGSTTWMQLTGAFMAANFEVEDKRSRVNGYHTEKIERFKRGDLSVHFKKRKRKSQKCFYPQWLDFIGEGMPAGTPIEKQWKKTDRVVWVKRAFELAPEMGCIEISKRLYEEGHRAWRDTRKPISKDAIADVLKDRSVLGEWQPNKTSKTESGGLLAEKRGEAICGILPAIISPEEFQKAQEGLKKRAKSKAQPRPREKKRWLFGNSTFCSKCGEKITFLSFPKPTFDDPDNYYYYLVCSAGYNRAVDICTCKKRFNAKKTGVDFELDVLERLTAYRWAELLTDEKHEKSLKAATAKKMRRHDKREEAKREVKRLRENLDAMLTSENINPVAINRIGELQAKANQVYEAANDQYNEAMLEEGQLRTRKSGKQAQKEIKERIKDFIENGRKDVRKRQEFSSWFYETGLVVVVELTSGRFEIGLGKRGEKGNLTELSFEDKEGFVPRGKTIQEIMDAREEIEPIAQEILKKRAKQSKDHVWSKNDLAKAKAFFKSPKKSKE